MVIQAEIDLLIETTILRAKLNKKGPNEWADRTALTLWLLVFRPNSDLLANFKVMVTHDISWRMGYRGKEQLYRLYLVKHLQGVEGCLRNRLSHHTKKDWERVFVLFSPNQIPGSYLFGNRYSYEKTMVISVISKLLRSLARTVRGAERGARGGSWDQHGQRRGVRSGVPKRSSCRTVMAMATSYKWLFLWDYTLYKWGYVSTYNW